MIYEADPGERIDKAAASAINQGCEKMIFNDRLYLVTVEYVCQGTVKINTTNRGEVT